MSVFSRVCLGFTFLLTALQVQASIVLGGTRIIYPSNQNEVQITLKNKDAYARPAYRGRLDFCTAQPAE